MTYAPTPSVPRGRIFFLRHEFAQLRSRRIVFQLCCCLIFISGFEKSGVSWIDLRVALGEHKGCAAFLHCVRNAQYTELAQAMFNGCSRIHRHLDGSNYQSLSIDVEIATDVHAGRDANLRPSVPTHAKIRLFFDGVEGIKGGFNYVQAALRHVIERIFDVLLASPCGRRLLPEKLMELAARTLAAVRQIETNTTILTKM